MRRKNLFCLIPVSDSPFAIRQGRLPKISLLKGGTSGWNSCFGTVIKAKSGNNYIGNVFVPSASGSTKIDYKEIGDKQQITCQIKGIQVTYEISGNTFNRITK